MIHFELMFYMNWSREWGVLFCILIFNFNSTYWRLSLSHWVVFMFVPLLGN
jgi:hypothetical protein